MTSCQFFKLGVFILDQSHFVVWTPQAGKPFQRMVNFSFKPLRQTVVEVGEWFRGPNVLFGSLSPRNRPTDI